MLSIESDIIHVNTSLLTPLIVGPITVRGAAAAAVELSLRGSHAEKYFNTL